MTDPAKDLPAPAPVKTVEAPDHERTSVLEQYRALKAEKSEAPPPANDNAGEAATEATQSPPPAPAAANDNDKPQVDRLNQLYQERLEKSRAARMAQVERQRQEEWQQREAAMRQRELEQQRLSERLKTEPIAALRDLGHEPDKLIEVAAQEASADVAYRRYSEQRYQDLEKKHSEAMGRIGQLEGFLQQRVQQESVIHQQQRETGFMSAKDSYPEAMEFYGDGARVLKAAKEVIAEKLAEAKAHGLSDAQAQAHVESVCTNANLWEYLNWTGKKELARLRGEGRAESGKAPQGKRATGPRPLSAEVSSERHASPKAPADMNDEERRAYAIQMLKDKKRKGAA